MAARWLSAFLNGLTVMFVLLFLRELIPRHPWAWTLGALAVALHPVFGFMGGSVNPDSLLFLLSAALFYLAARVFRLGLTTRRAVAIGAVAVLGCLTKGTTYALLPGLGLAALIGAWRLHRAGTAAMAILFPLASGAAVFVFGFGGYLWLNTQVLSKSPASAGAFVTTNAAQAATSLRGQLEYTWQFFFPRIGEMADAFPGYPSYPFWDFYIKGFVGRFGWWQYDLPLTAQWIGLAVIVMLLVLAAVAIVPRLRRLPLLRAELAVYVIVAVTVLLLVSVAGYRFTAVNGLDFEQTRYIMPLLPLYGALVAAAALAFRRWGPAAGAVLLVLLAAHSFAGQLLALSRYYS